MQHDWVPHPLYAAYQIQYVKRTVTASVSISAAGTASHTPVTPRIRGKTNRKNTIRPNVRRNDMAADALPFDNAVNKADEKILNPENKKLNEKMLNPLFVSAKTFLLFSANIFAMFSPPSRENRNTNMEIPAINRKQIRTVFFSCSAFPLP